MDKNKFDIAIIGGGPGGYVAAIRAASQNKRVALIEKNEMGGTCLNRGCIPSKTLIANADLLRKIKKASDFGLNISGFTIQYEIMQKQKKEVVKKIRTSLEKLISDHQITVFSGHGSFTSSNEIKIISKDPCLIQADKVIIATGSEPKPLPTFAFDHHQIHDSTSILEISTLPKKMVIIGGGIIGCEFASLFAELGVEITIVELLPSILSTESKEISQYMSDYFKKKGICLILETSVTQIEKNSSSLKVFFSNLQSLEVDSVLVSIGRTLNTSQIQLEKAGVKKLENGVIPVNDKMQTNVSHIYAIGDITGKWLLAHVASHQGIIAADNACGIPSLMHYDAVPSVIYTYPEVASVGLSLEKAQLQGFNAIASQFPFQALGKSHALRETEGFAQVVTDKKTGQILGAQVIGYDASTLIAEMSIAIQNELTIESIQETIHAHPTVSESWLEAAFLATGMPMHFPPKKKSTRATPTI